MGCRQSRRPKGSFLVENHIERGPLTEYFLGRYLEGELFSGPKYQASSAKGIRAPVLQHVGTDIQVWSEVVDLRPADSKSSGILLYLYTGRTGFLYVASGNKTPNEILASFETDENAHFGNGVYMCCKEPQLFATKDDILINKFWPRVADPDLADRQGHETNLLKSRYASAGPDHHANRRVREALINNTDHAGMVDYCIPFLVPECYAYSIWERLPPDVSGTVSIGQNRWGERQYPGRDIWVVQLDPAGKDRSEKAGPRTLIDVYRKRHARLEQECGPRQRDVLSSLNNLGVLLEKSGQYEEAELLHRRALEARRQALGKKHPDTLNSMNNLAALLALRGKALEAEKLYRSLVERMESARCYGPAHPNTLVCLNNLAALLKQRGDFAEAQSLLQRVVRSREARSRNQPETLTALNNLAVAMIEKGSYFEAQPILIRAMEERNFTLGTQHPGTLECLHNNAVLLERMGRHREAEATYRKALECREASLGPSHADTLETTSSLAGLLRVVGRRVEAEPLLWRILEGREAMLGPNHPETLDALNNNAVLLDELGRHSEAEPLYRRAVEGKQALFGSEHPQTLTSLSNLAVLLRTTGNNIEAEPLMRRVVELREAALGVHHPDTIKSVRDLGLLMEAMGRDGEAESLFRRVSEHPVSTEV